MTVPHEYRAWLPGDRDLAVAPHFTEWMSRDRMIRLLELHKDTPKGNRGVKVKTRPLVLGKTDKDFPIP
jgi:hypothetical protein